MKRASAEGGCPVEKQSQRAADSRGPDPAAAGRAGACVLAHDHLAGKGAV